MKTLKNKSISSAIHKMVMMNQILPIININDPKVFDNISVVSSDINQLVQEWTKRQL